MSDTVSDSEIARRVRARLSQGEDPWASGDLTIQQLKMIVCAHAWAEFPMVGAGASGYKLCRSCGEQERL